MDVSFIPLKDQTHVASGAENVDASKHLTNPRNFLCNGIFLVSVNFCDTYNHSYDHVG